LSPWRRPSPAVDLVAGWPSGGVSRHVALSRDMAQEEPTPSGVEVPAAGEVDLTQAHRLVLIEHSMGHGDAHVWPVFPRRRAYS
jgi:hypothetical protein